MDTPFFLLLILRVYCTEIKAKIHQDRKETKTEKNTEKKTKRKTERKTERPSQLVQENKSNLPGLKYQIPHKMET